MESIAIEMEAIIGGWQGKFSKFTFTMKSKLNMAKLGTFCLRFWFHYGNQIKAGLLLSPGGRVEVAEIEITLPLWVVRWIKVES